MLLESIEVVGWVLDLELGFVLVSCEEFLVGLVMFVVDVVLNWFKLVRDFVFLGGSFVLVFGLDGLFFSDGSLVYVRLGLLEFFECCCGLFVWIVVIVNDEG